MARFGGDGDGQWQSGGLYNWAEPTEVEQGRGKSIRELNKSIFILV